MDQGDETTQRALSYIRHQASKSLGELRVLAERTAADCGRSLESISEEQARFKPGDEWSVKDVLDHLIYSTAHAVIHPIRDLAAGRTPRPFAPDSSHGLSTKPIRELREDLGRLLEDTVELVSSLRESDQIPGTWEHPFLGPLNLRELLALHRLHVTDHVQQIQKIKANPGYPTDRTY